MILSAAVLIAVLVVAVAPIVRVLACRARRAHAQPDRILAESCPPSEAEPGTEPLRLLDDLEAHLKQYGAAIADLYEPARPSNHTTSGDQT